MRSPFETAAFRVGLAMVAVLLFRSGIAAEVAADLPAPARSVPGAGKSATPRSLWLQEITKLIKAGTDETILLPFIANTEGTFNLDPASIAELKALGATPAVLSAMIQHDRELVTGARPLLASSAPAPPAAPKAAAAPEGTANPVATRFHHRAHGATGGVWSGATSQPATPFDLSSPDAQSPAHTIDRYYCHVPWGLPACQPGGCL